jgi:gliding motility associated protien GldN
MLDYNGQFMKSKFKIIVCTGILAGSFLTAGAQSTPDSLPVDGYYRQNALENAKPVPYPKVNPNNVRFYKRIWRDIDLNDPENYIFVTEGSTLIEIIMDAIKDGKLKAYDPISTKENPTGDAFTTVLTPQQAMGRLTDSVLVPRFDDDGNQIGAEMKLNDFNPANITKFRVKEDIFYDKQRSRIETRIIGLAPLMKVTAAGEMVSEVPAFWLYFPQCRMVFVTKEVIDPKRNINNMSFDDVFIQHAFKSQIIKESNPGELSIKDYVQDKEQLQEANRIEIEINEYKKKTWRH